MSFLMSTIQKIIIKSYYMKISPRQIKKTIKKEYNCIQLTIPSPYDDIFDIVSFPDHEGWVAMNLGEKYKMVKLKSETLRFEYLYVFQETDHAQLLEIIQTILGSFKSYQLEYPKVYQKYMEKFRQEIDEMDNCFLNPIQMAQEINKFTFYYFDESKNSQQIQSRLQRLKQFKKELLIFPFSDKMRSKFDLDASQVTNFLKSLLEIYEQKLINKCSGKMQKLGLGLGAIIQKIQPYIRRESQYKFPYLDADAGIMITIHGFQETYCKIFGFFQRWIDNLNTAILQMPYIECCEIQNLPNYFQKNYKTSHVIVLSPKKPIRILLLQPPNRRDQDQIMQFFLRSKRIISGLQFQKFNFRKLNQLKDKFLCFLQETNFRHKVDVYNDYIVTKCSRAQENKLRELTTCFLQNYIEQQVTVDNFKDPFEIAIFEGVYCANYLKRGNYVKFYKLGKYLYRQNYKKDADEIQTQLRQIQFKLKKQLILVPVVRSPPSEKLYFKQMDAKQWENPRFLYSQMFVIGRKVKLNLRNYASISKNQEECVFIIQGNRTKQCAQLIEQLKQQGCSNIEKKLYQNPIMGFSLRNSRYFDDITSFKLAMIDERDTRKMLHLKQDIHKMINDFKSRHLKIVLPQDADRSAKILLPIVIEYVLNILNLRSESKINQITFFVSKNESQYKPLVESLQGLRNRLQIERKTSLYLRKGDISKIITYGYYSLKYYQDNQNCQGSNLNSFIFQFNLRKKKKTPIFLLSPKEQNLKCEYLVSCSTNRVHQIKNYFIKEVGEHISEKLKAIRDLIKKYFQNVEYFVINGNPQGTQFTENLYYTSSSENHYKNLEKVCINITKCTIVSSNKKFVRYQLMKSQFLSLKMVQTHKSKQAQLLEDMSLIALK